jgi:hypothetical protein
LVLKHCKTTEGLNPLQRGIALSGLVNLQSHKDAKGLRGLHPSQRRIAFSGLVTLQSRKDAKIPQGFTLRKG